jgi:hypothetical protein
MRLEGWVASPEPAVGVFTTARTCQAPPASLRDRLRRPLTEPVSRQVRQLSGSGEGPGQDRALSQGRADLEDGDQDQRLTATVTATAAANRCQQRPATAHNTRTIHANWGYVRPEKRTVGTGTASAATVANTVAKPLDNACPVRTTLECRPSTRTAADGPGRFAHSYGSEGWGFESLRARPAHRPVARPAAGFLVALGATLGATDTCQPPNSARLIDSAAARLSPSSRCPYTSLVIAMLACPSTSETTCSGVPWALLVTGSVLILLNAWVWGFYRVALVIFGERVPGRARRRSGTSRLRLRASIGRRCPVTGAAGRRGLPGAAWRRGR